MSNFQIGEEVLLNGKTYKIIGTHKRSFLLDLNGKTYKATAAKMGKIKNQNALGIGNGRKARTKKSDTFYMEKRLAYRKIFQSDAKLPETHDEYMNAFSVICSELSPENLHCDGEISRTAAMKKYRALKAEWKELEKKFGHKVSEDEVWAWERKNNNYEKSA